ncbi:type III secretion apparatus [Parashewanella tropica]|uniref:type III secretion apparatus n=1 Tax=Parashewanella tropica TaxID=2547970 RepID=UPI0010598E0F|nr:type III secretion apparatus [Parashewanella tropica]
MDLRSSRKLEELFQLLEKWPVTIDEQMEYHWEPYGVMLEMKDERLLMTSWLLNGQIMDLKPCLARWHPQIFMGVPQRLFSIKQKLMISCLCPTSSEGRDWFQMLKLQQQFLDRVGYGADS